MTEPSMPFKPGPHIEGRFEGKLSKLESLALRLSDHDMQNNIDAFLDGASAEELSGFQLKLWECGALLTSKTANLDLDQLIRTKGTITRAFTNALRAELVKRLNSIFAAAGVKKRIRQERDEDIRYAKEKKQHIDLYSVVAAIHKKTTNILEEKGKGGLWWREENPINHFPTFLKSEA